MIQVNRENRTIYVSSEGSAEAMPDVATVQLGYENFAITENEAYNQNVSVMDKLTKALEAAGVKQQQITTGTVRVERAQPDEQWTQEMRKARQFHAQHTLSIKVAANDAQSIIDLAMAAGANMLRDVEWSVSDPVKLQSEAGRNALEKARAVADLMAKGLNAKLGLLVYASNTAPIRAGMLNFLFGSLNTESATVSAKQAGRPKLRLFPEKVTERTSVYAVFAIE